MSEKAQEYRNALLEACRVVPEGRALDMLQYALMAEFGLKPDDTSQIINEFAREREGRPTGLCNPSRLCRPTSPSTNEEPAE